MNYIKYIFLFFILPPSINGQILNEFEKGTDPKSIDISRINSHTMEPFISNTLYLYYYNKDGKLDSLNKRDKDDLSFKKEFYFSDTSNYKIHKKYRKGSLIDISTSYFDSTDFLYHQINEKNIGSKHQLLTNILNVKNEKGKKQFQIRKSISENTNEELIVIQEYFYFMDSVLNKVISFTSRNPIDTTSNAVLAIANRELFVPKITWDLNVEFRNDTIFNKHFKDGHVETTEICYKKKDYEFCEVDYQPLRKKFRMIEGEIMTKDSTVNYTISFNYIDSVFVKDVLTYRAKYRNSYHSYVYDYNIKEYSRKRSGVYTYTYDEKKNWIRRKLEKQDGSVEIYVRKIIYQSP